MKGSLRGISKLSQRPAELGLLERLCAPRHELGLKFGRGGSEQCNIFPNRLPGSCGGDFSTAVSISRTSSVEVG